MLNDKIVSVDLMWSKAGGDFGTTDNFRKFTGAINSAYQVFTTYDATLLDVLQAPGIPTAGSSYSPDFPFVYAEQAKPRRISPIYWIVDVSYSGEVSFASGEGDGGNQDQGNRPQSPLLTPAVIDWDDVEVELEIDQDYNGNPIVTANGEPINGVRRLFADQTVTIQKNMLVFNPFVQARYRQSVNSDPFLGWPPGTAKMQKFQAKSVRSSEVRGGGYWQVTAVIQFRYPYRTTPEKAWYARVRHEGYYKRIIVPDVQQGPRGVFRATIAGEPTAKPVLLDFLGQEIKPTAPPDNFTAPPPIQAHWLEIKLYEPLSYNALGLLP